MDTNKLLEYAKQRKAFFTFDEGMDNYDKGFTDAMKEIIAKLQEIQDGEIIIGGRIEGDWQNDEETPHDIYAVSDSLPLDGKVKYGDRVKIQITKIQ